VDELAASCASMAAFYRVLGGAARGGRALERDGVVASVVPGLPDAGIANALVYRRAEGLVGALPDAVAAWDAAGVRIALAWVLPGDEAAEEGLAAHGFARRGEAPAMARELADIAPDDDPLEDWTDAPAPAELAEIVERSYGLGEGSVAVTLASGIPAAATYVARVDGRPASCLVIVRAGGDAGVFMVGTVPEARGRGLARRLLLQALLDARAAGATTTTLQSSRLGFPVYRRLGYREFGRIGMWERTR
jgi:GNAT superfamily N-acetyltransferase